ncbi:MAG: TIGR03620 family F420-dependent LLM class oxidoreductase [Solirubrobacterales bacterium]
MELGRFGVWTTHRQIGEENAGAAARLAEECGYGAFWLGGSPRLPQVRPLLEASERIAVGTSIVNIWAYEPARLAAEYAELASAFGERLLVGVGVGHPEATSDYRRPLRAMREFLDGIDSAPHPIPPERRALAALGPKMLDLAGERSAGTIPYFVPVEHTSAARERLGPEALVATEIACVVDPDPARARATARQYARLYLGLTNYTANLRRFGFGDADIEGEGSDRLIDSVVPHGSAAEVAAVARAHLEAGADHVALQPVGGEGIPAEAWRALAAELN